MEADSGRRVDSVTDVVEAWRARIAHQRPLFAPLAPGSRIGVVRESLVADEGEVRAGSLVVWTRGASGVDVTMEPYPGFESVDVDVLIAIDDVASGALATGEPRDWLRTLRTMIRGGHVLLFARRPRAALEDAGYDDLLYELGFAYLGACR